MASSEEHERPHFIFIWTLENITERSYIGFTSPSFIADTIDNGSWCLVLWEYKDKLLCRLCKDHEDGKPESYTELVYETAIITADGSVINAERLKRRFEPEHVYMVRGSTDVGETVLLSEKDASNRKGILAIRCRMWKPESKYCKTSFSFAHTRLKQERRYFTWIIHEFSTLAIGQRRSFHLQVTPKGDLLRVLDLYLQCEDGEDKVCIEKPKKLSFEVSCKISVIDATGNVVCSKSISDDSALIKITKLMCNKSLYLPGDKLYLRCECEIDYGFVSSRIENYEQFSLPANSCVMGTMAMNDDRTEKNSCCPCCCPLKRIVKKYYENGELTDINLRAGNESFHAHKIILSAKSKVFEEMFTKDPTKKGRKTIELTDFDPDILHRFLLFVYTEDLTDLTPETGIKLYKIAVKYELQDLRGKCSKFLESNLSTDNIFPILILAEKQRDECLKSSACTFVFKHDSEIFSSDDWKNFKKKYPILAMDVMQQVYSFRCVFSDISKKLLEIFKSED